MKRIGKQELQSLYAPVTPEVEAGVNRALSALPERKEKPVMKKKMTALVLIAALLTLTVTTALAASNWEKISAFLGLNGTVAHLDVNEEAIAAPGLTENSSQWLVIQPEEAYWSEEGLHVVLHVAAADDRKLVVSSTEIDGGGEEADVPLDDKHIWINEKNLTVGEWRQGKEILSFEIWSGGEGWDYYKRDETGEDYIMTLFDVDADALTQGAALSFEVAVHNLITGAREQSALTIQLPPMTRQPGRK